MMEYMHLDQPTTDKLNDAAKEGWRCLFYFSPSPNRAGVFRALMEREAVVKKTRKPRKKKE